MAYVRFCKRHGWIDAVPPLRKLEVDPVIQAAGRVRFLTRPREVVFFQMDDLARDLGDVREVSCLADLRVARHVGMRRDDLRQRITRLNELPEQRDARLRRAGVQVARHGTRG